MHTPGVHAFLVDFVDRLLVPVLLGESVAAKRLAVLEDSAQLACMWCKCLTETRDARCVGAGNDNTLDLWLLGSRLQGPDSAGDRAVNEVGRLFDVPVEWRGHVDDSATWVLRNCIHCTLYAVDLLDTLDSLVECIVLGESQHGDPACYRASDSH